MPGKSTQTILVLVIACVVGYLAYPHRYLLTVAVILGLIGVFFPYLTEKIHWAWMKLGHALGFVTSRVILIVIFFVFLFPIAVCARLFRRKEAVRLNKQASTYLKDRNFLYTRESMENPW